MKIQDLLYYTFIIFLLGCTSYHQVDSKNEKLPLIYPDYIDVTFPVNIAPLILKYRSKGGLSDRNRIWGWKS